MEHCTTSPFMVSSPILRVSLRANCPSLGLVTCTHMWDHSHAFPSAPYNTHPCYNPISSLLQGYHSFYSKFTSSPGCWISARDIPPKPFLLHVVLCTFCQGASFTSVVCVDLVVLRGWWGGRGGKGGKSSRRIKKGKLKRVKKKCKKGWQIQQGECWRKGNIKRRNEKQTQLGGAFIV